MPDRAELFPSAAFSRNGWYAKSSCDAAAGYGGGRGLQPVRQWWLDARGAARGLTARDAKRVVRGARHEFPRPRRTAVAAATSG